MNFMFDVMLGIGMACTVCGIFTGSPAGFSIGVALGSFGSYGVQNWVTQ